MAAARTKKTTTEEKTEAKTTTVRRGTKRKSTDAPAGAPKTTAPKKKSFIDLPTEADKASYVSQVQELTQALNGAIKSDNGEHFTMMGGSVGRWDSSDLVRTGIIGLDMATGIGGLPLGRIVELYGEPSSGKSTTALHVIVEAQKIGIPCIYKDAENAFLRDYADKIGVDLNALPVDQSGILDDAINNAIVEIETIFERTGRGALIVFDSVAAFVTRNMYGKQAGDNTMMEVSRMWSQQLPKLQMVVAKTRSLVILINQIRSGSTGGFAGGFGSETTGGKAIKFYSTLRINVKRNVDKTYNTKDRSLTYHGQEVSFVIEKNKVASPFSMGRAVLPADERFDRVEGLLDAGVKHGVLYKGVKAERNPNTGFIELSERGNYYTYVLMDEEVDYLNEAMPQHVEFLRERENRRKRYAARFDKDYEIQDIEDWTPVEHGHFYCFYYAKTLRTFLEENPYVAMTMEQRILNTLSEPDLAVDRYISPETVHLKAIDFEARDEYGDLGEFEMKPRS